MVGQDLRILVVVDLYRCQSVPIFVFMLFLVCFPAFFALVFVGRLGPRDVLFAGFCSLRFNLLVLIFVSGLLMQPLLASSNDVTVLVLGS